MNYFTCVLSVDITKIMAALKISLLSINCNIIHRTLLVIKKKLDSLQELEEMLAQRDLYHTEIFSVVSFNLVLYPCEKLI